MIFKILKAAGSSVRSINYNERKVMADEAELIRWENLPSGSLYSIYRTMERLENNPAVSAQIRSFSFHATLGPGVSDTTTEKESLELISRLMDDLGYGKQPYAVYRHHDIDRLHYHIVSVRVDEDGYGIGNHFEGRNANELLQKYAQEYHYTVGRDETQLSQVFERDMNYERFDYGKSNLREQFRSIFEKALRYNYTSFRQFRTVLNSKGIDVSVVKGKGGVQKLMFQGLNSEGRVVTKPLLEKDISVDAYAMYESARDEHFEQIQTLSKEAARTAAITQYCLANASSEGEFIKMMQAMSVLVSFEHSEGDVRRPMTGVTIVDDKTHTCWKQNELGSDCSLEKFNEALSSGHWGADKRKTGAALTARQKSEIENLIEEAVNEIDRFQSREAAFNPDEVSGMEYEFDW